MDKMDSLVLVCMGRASLLLQDVTDHPRASFSSVAASPVHSFTLKTAMLGIQFGFVPIYFPCLI